MNIQLMLMEVNKILYVDDDEDDYEIFAEIVKAINAEVEIIYLADACEIEKYLMPPFPDIIVVDMQMPKLDGIECLKKIRAKKELDHVPVVMYSAVYSRVEEALNEGANHFMIKEASLENMKNTIMTTLGIK